MPFKAWSTGVTDLINLEDIQNLLLNNINIKY